MRRIMIVWEVVLILFGLSVKVASSGQKNSSIAELITQQAIVLEDKDIPVPVTVDGKLYLIYAIKNRIDPITCKIVPNSGVTKVYLDMKHYPVSNPDIAQKVGLIDLARIWQQDIGSSENLHKRQTQVSERWKIYAQIEYEDAIVEAIPTGFGPEKLLVEALVDLIVKIIKETVSDPMTELRDDIAEKGFWEIQNNYLAVQKIARDKIENYDVAYKYLRHYWKARAYERAVFSLLDWINKMHESRLERVRDYITDVAWGKITFSLSAFVGLVHEGKKATDLEWEYNDMIDIELRQVQEKLSNLYGATEYTLELSKGCGEPAIVLDAPWPMVRHDSQHTGRSPYPGPERPSLKWKIRSSNCRWVAIAKEGTIYGEFSSEFGGGTQLCAINSDGRLKWKSEVGYAPLGIVDTGVIYVSGDWKSGDSSVSGRAELWGISPKGTIQLEKEIIDAPPIPEDVTKRIATNSLIIGNDGTIYFVLGNRKSAILYSFSQNGSLNWKFLFVPAGSGHPLPATCKDGTICLISKEKGSCFLNAITPNGKLKWRYEISVDNLIDWKIEKETANLKGKGVPYSARYRQQRRTFLREHGFGFPRFAHYDFPQLVIGDDGTIYLVVVGDFLCAISPEGFLRWKKWRINEGNFSGCSLPAIGVDGTIYISAYISTIRISSSDSLRHKVIAFGSKGQFRWSSVPLRELRTPLTVDSNGTVYFADNQGIVHALNRDGTLKWRFSTDQPANAYLSGGTIAIGKNGVLYFLGGFTNYPQQQYGYLYAIGEAK